jgi:hypothetical protein
LYQQARQYVILFCTGETLHAGVSQYISGNTSLSEHSFLLASFDNDICFQKNENFSLFSEELEEVF